MQETFKAGIKVSTTTPTPLPGVITTAARGVAEKKKRLLCVSLTNTDSVAFQQQFVLLLLFQSKKKKKLLALCVNAVLVATV